MKKNVVFIGISISLLVLLGIGFSYSMWNITVNQDTVSTMHTDCFDLTISNKENNISLENAYPISNSKGMKLTPYTFTVTNTCDITAEYNVNLEVLKNSTLASNFIDVMLDGNINLLSSYDKTEKIDNSSIESRKIDTGILKSNESKDYSLRLWIDYDTTLEDLNNETKIFKAKVNIVGKPINYSGDTVFNFDYTGGKQTFTVPVSGTYKLETWGAQGGNYNSSFIGGVGGYSNGLIFLNKNKEIFINIGGKGEDIKFNYDLIPTGGYNGGGNGSSCYNFGTYQYTGGAAGGGATHIATKSGLLSSFARNKSDVLIVSGAGGGVGGYSGAAGSGGGYIGNGSGKRTAPNAEWGGNSFGGNQQSGFTFGQGQPAIKKNVAFAYGSEGNGGSGSGYYGGYNTYDEGSLSNDSGGGGSGYIGNSLLKDKVMYCYNCEESNEVGTKTISTTCSEETPTSYCAKKGNGYARITLVSIDN